ncbi:hypothetical protein [Streptomyces sp. NPDC003327]
MTTAPSLVLRGSGESVLRFEGGPVTLRRADKEHHIPLEAIALVHAEGRSLAIALAAAGASEPTVYRVTDVSEAAAVAFADAVTAALPAPAGEVDGAALVTTRTLAAPEPRPVRTWVLGGLAAAPLVALGVYIGVAGPRIEYAIVYGMALVFGAIGSFMVWSMGGEAYRQWRLPRHGITVLGEFTHYTNNRKVYRYTDTEGGRHTYTATSGPNRIELAYDPRDPERVVRPAGFAELCGTLCVTLLGCGIAGGALFAAGALVVAAARG